MDLRIASTWFDDTVFQDAYDPSVTFYAQVEPLDYYKIDGAAVKRRVMSTAHNVHVPPRRTIKLDDQVYLVGDDAVDHFQGEVVRNRYVMAGADHLATVYSIEGFLTSAPKESVWASVVFNKLTTDERVSSAPVPEFQIYFGPLESVAAHSVIDTGDALYWVMTVVKALSGLLAATAVRIEDQAPITVQYSTWTYDPVTDSKSLTQRTSQALMLRWAQDFDYVDEGTPKYVHGDRMLIVLNAGHQVPKAGDVVTVGADTWKVVNTKAEGGTSRLHVRRA